MSNCEVNITTSVTSVFFSSPSIGVLKHLEICLHTFNFLFGFPLHSYVLWLIVKGTGSGVASEFFNLNLSVCELANSLLNLLVQILDCWFTGVKAFKYFVSGLGVSGRPLFQCLMCVERYLAVVHPVTFLKYKPLRYRLICSVVAWITTLGGSLCCMFTRISCQLYVYICCFAVLFLLLLFIQLFCLVAVLRALKQSGPGERKREKEENHMKRRAFYIILITTVSMTIIYIPFSIAGLFYILTRYYFQEPFTFAFFCYILFGFVQPVLYLNRVGKLPWHTIFNNFIFRN